MALGHTENWKSLTNAKSRSTKVHFTLDPFHIVDWGTFWGRKCDFHGFLWHLDACTNNLRMAHRKAEERTSRLGFLLNNASINLPPSRIATTHVNKCIRYLLNSYTSDLQFTYIHTDITDLQTLYTFQVLNWSFQVLNWSFQVLNWSYFTTVKVWKLIYLN